METLCQYAEGVFLRNVKDCKVITGSTGFSAGGIQRLVEKNVDCTL